MHVITAGPEDGTPILLLHGFPEFWYSWRFQITALAAAGYRVIAPDQRGYNLTDKHGPFDVATLVQDIVDLQNAFGISKSHVAAHDWGGVIGWAFAGAHPDRVDRLVIMNGPHPAAYADACKSYPVQFRRSWYIYFFQLPWLPEWSLRRKNFDTIDRVFRRLPNRPMTEADIQHYKDAFSQPGALTAMVNWYRALPWQIIRSGFRPQNPIVRAKTCVIWGERDRALVKGCCETLDRYVPDLRVHYLPRATHWVQMDHANDVNEIMLQFLREQ
jgi:pimeloyl-ACP methyl ester carboxylesterase